VPFKTPPPPPEEEDLPTIELVPTSPLGGAPTELTVDVLPIELLQKALPFEEPPADRTIDVDFDSIRPPLPFLPPHDAVAPIPAMVPALATALPLDAREEVPVSGPALPTLDEEPASLIRKVAALAAECTNGASVPLPLGLTQESWAGLEQRCAALIASELERGETTLRDAYDDAYLDARPARRGRFDVDAFVELELELRSSDAVPQTLVPDVADAMRLRRVLTRRLASDPSFAAELEAARARAGALKRK